MSMLIGRLVIYNPAHNVSDGKTDTVKSVKERRLL